jgi:hypothetical protein
VTSRRYSDSYLEALLGHTEEAWEPLRQLGALVDSWSGFDRTRRHYGVAPELFAFVETLMWLSSSSRSGSITYFEVAPEEVQLELAALLLAYAPPEIAQAFRNGVSSWRNGQSLGAADAWVDANEGSVAIWLLDHARAHRELLRAVA